MVSYSFTPGADGTFTDMSNFTVSETSSQSDGEDFSVSLAGVGGAGTATTAATTSTTAPTATTVPLETMPPPGGGGDGGAPPPGGSPPNGSTSIVTQPVDPRVALEHPEVAAGDEESAAVRGYRPGEVVMAVQLPGATNLGSQIADSNGVVRFTWTIAESEPPGAHVFEATGEQPGTVSAGFLVVASDDDSGMSPWLIALIVALVVAAIAGVVVFAYRRGRHEGDHHDEPSEEPAS
jgi:hypothetical protein